MFVVGGEKEGMLPPAWNYSGVHKKEEYFCVRINEFV